MQTIDCRRESGWLTIWFNRPDVRNALSSEMTEELATVLDEVREDRSLRGITLRGRGGVFCAGGDLKGFRRMASGAMTEAEIARMSEAGGRLFARIASQPQVIVALIEGAAMAGGMGLACTADVVAVTRDARFALTETTIGLPPAQIAPFVVERIGLPQARRLMVTGARFDGAEAWRIGLADMLVEDAAELDAAEADLRRGVMRCAPGANAVTKELLRAVMTTPADDMRRRAGAAFARCLSGEEGREGVASFLEKRAPSWVSRG